MNRRHNLEGWLRDVRSCLMADRYDTLGHGMLDMLRDIVEELTSDGGSDDGEEADGPDESTAEELESEDDHDDVVVPGPGDGRRLRPHDRRLVSSGKRAVGGTAGMADPLPRDVPKARGRSAGGRASVARTGKGVKRGKK